MSFFDSGLVNFIKLLLIVGLISMLYILIMQKIKEQNHKISSLLSLVTTMANEITALKEPEKKIEPQICELKDEISDDSDSDDSDDSDSDDSDSDESINLGEIDLVKGDKITMTESDFKEFELSELNESDLIESDLIKSDLIESVLPESEFLVSEVKDIVSPDDMELKTIKKMNIQQLIQAVVSKKLKTPSEANKLKKKDLLSLLE
uniref:Rho termination factor N-terminal domain-containing protein n=1 Tax=viral metagenome TaxID=1070528 RepID=A0A6C0HSU6_9ZZZZ